MILFINGIINGVQCNHVGYPIPNHESAFELLTQLVADGWIVQEALVFDGWDRLNVPVEAFDGQSIRPHIDNLQRQWQQLLSAQLVPPDILNNLALTNWYVQLEAYYSELIEHLEKTISFVEMRQARLARYPNKSLCFKLQKHYKNLLASNQKMRDQTNKSRQLTSNRLEKLKNGR